VLVVIALALLALTPAWSAQQVDQPAAEHPAQPADEHAAASDHGEGGHGLWWGLLWPTVNFAILCGLLYYFLKAPTAAYLRDRHTAIRKDLVEAAALKESATSQLAEIDRRVKALPGEIEALRKRGADEIAAEEKRIAALAEAERSRLVEQTRREIDHEVRRAKRELIDHTADLAVRLATDRIEKTITPADQIRLVDRYLDDVQKEQ
jgi:F-type H+-transporting ATPase subunit b